MVKDDLAEKRALGEVIKRDRARWVEVIWE